MTDVLQASASSGTNTTRRHLANTETPRRREAPVNQPQNRARSFPTPPIELVQIESGSHVYGIALGRNDESIVLAPDERESAILQTPGTNLPFRLQRVLPYMAPYTPLAGCGFEEVIERLWSCDDLLARRCVRSPALTQIQLSADKWMAQVRAWASSFPQTDHAVDDSRESNYGDRV